MTRRPPMPPDGNVRRAHQRMAPGGRLWSESPVRGPAVRVVSAGPEPETTPPDDYARLGGYYTAYDQTVFDIRQIVEGTDLPPPDEFGRRTPDVGDVLVVFGAGRWSGATPPAGWTTLASGASGSQRYWSGYLRATGSSDNYEVTVAPTTADSIGYLGCARYRYVDGWTPALGGTAGMSGGASQLVIPGAQAGHTLPTSMVAALSPDNNTLFRTTTPPTFVDDTGGAGYADTGKAWLWVYADTRTAATITEDFYSDSGLTVPYPNADATALTYGFTT